MLSLSKVSNHARPISRSMRLAVPLGLALVIFPLALAATQAVPPPPNRPPVFTSFSVAADNGDVFTFQGSVTDLPGTAEGYVVRFGGIVSGMGLTATVNANGNFSASFSIPGLQGGTATADTSDAQGAAAQTATYYLAI